MDARDILHWSALSTAVWALIWFLSPYVGLVPLAIPLGIVAFTLVLVSARRIPETHRTLTYVGAIGGLAMYVAYVFLFLSEGAFTFGEDNPVSFNDNPPQALSTLKGFLDDYIALVGLALFVLAFWGAWNQRERALGAAGAGLNVLVVILAAVGVGGGAEETALDLVLGLLFALSFLLLGIAAALPLFLAHDEPTVWSKEQSTTPAGVATPNETRGATRNR